MQRSAERILTTHTGSLPRPRALTRLHARRARGEQVDLAELGAAAGAAVHAIVPKQLAAGRWDVRLAVSFPEKLARSSSWNSG